jgi:hypothetical protein
LRQDAKAHKLVIIAYLQFNMKELDFREGQSGGLTPDVLF